MTEPGSRSSVRIELDGAGDVGAVAPAAAPAGGRPVVLIALVVALVAGFVGLLAVSGDSDAVEDASADDADDSSIGGDLRLSEEDRVWIGDVPLFSVVVDGIDGWYAVSGELLYTSDAPTGWERVNLGTGSLTLDGEPRVLDVSSSGDGVNVLVAGPTSFDTDARATMVQVLRSTDGVAWRVLDEAVIPDVVHAGSLNVGDWSVLAGPGQVPASDDAAVVEQVADRLWVQGGDNPVRLRLADNDRVRSHVAIPGGAVAISSTVDFFSTPSGIELPTRLLRLSATTSDVADPNGADLDDEDRVVRSGDGTLWLVDGLRAWSSVAPYETWTLYADATDLPGVNRIEPALTGGGVVAKTDEPRDGGFHFTTGDGTWQQFTFPGVSDLGVLLVQGSELTLSAVVDGTRQITIVRTVDQSKRPQIVPTPITDGDWDLPVLAADASGNGFVGLTNVNGLIGWFESEDGLTWDTPIDTDLPFGFFANHLERAPGGWHLTGRVGLLEDAAFTSANGTNWDRLAFDLPRGATAVELDVVSTSPTTNAVLGSLGWADDLSRTERFLLWWEADEAPIDVPLRPCPETQGICTIRSIAVIDGGLLATHLADQRFTLSRWTAGSGWEQLGVDQPLPDAPVNVRSGSTGVSYLGRDRVLRSDDGEIWSEVFDRIAGVGPYVAVSHDGQAALAVDDDALVMRTPWGTESYAEPDVQFGAVLAITSRAAIVRVITPDGPALARLASPERISGFTDVPAEAFEKMISDPRRPGTTITVFDDRLHETTDLETWTPVSRSLVGAGRVLDLSMTDGGFTLLLATPGVTQEGAESTWVSVSRQSGEIWEWLGTAVVPLRVGGGSLNGTDWVVRAGPSLRTEDLGTADQLVNDLSSWLYVGSAGDSEVTRIPTGASELAVDVVSSGGGAFYLSVDLDFFNSSPPSLQLKRWEPDLGVITVHPGGRSVTEDDHLWLSGTGVMHLARDGEVWTASAPYDALGLAR